MKQFTIKNTCVALAVAAFLAACGGGSDGASTTTTPTGTTQTNGGTKPTAFPTGANSAFPFFGAAQPFIQIKEISDADFSNTKTLVGGETFDTDGIYALGEELPFKAGKRYLVTLKSPVETSKQAIYVSSTRTFTTETCLKNSVSSAQPCLPEDGRNESLKSTWSTVVDFTASSVTDADLKRPFYISPLSSLVVERARRLTTPSGGGLSLDAALDKATRELQSNLTLPFGSLGATSREFPYSKPELENLTSVDNASIEGIALGMLERLTQQMNTSITENATGAGYSEKYTQLFASFARDGKFETLQEAASGNSTGLREVGALLNSALTQFLLKDAPRFQNVRFSNFAAEDYILTSGAQTMRQKLGQVYSDLYESNGGAVTTVAFVAGDDGKKAQDTSITAIAARESGIFFLTSNGEAQTANKARTQCKPESFGAPASYEVTGVAALESAIKPMVLAYSHTSTTAYLIDVSKIGLSNAAAGTTVTCSLPSGAFRAIDLTDVNAGAPLYQAARQYQHNGKPVNLTSAAYDARTNKVLLTTIDGVLSFDVIPTDGGNATTGTLSAKLAFRDFRAFPANAANIGVGLGMNASYDNTGNILWSPFDYSQDNTATNNNNLKGLFALDYSSVAKPFSSNRNTPTFLAPTGFDKPSLNVVAQTGSINSQFGVAAFSGISSQSEPSDYCHTERFQNPDSNTPTTYASSPTDPSVVISRADRDPFGRVNFLPTNRQNFLINGGMNFSVFGPNVEQYQQRFSYPAPSTATTFIGGLLGPAPEPARAPEFCTLGYHGFALQNRTTPLYFSSNTPLLAVAPVQPYRGRDSENRNTRGAIGLMQLLSPKVPTNNNATGDWESRLRKLPSGDDVKFFTVLPNRGRVNGIDNADKRDLVLDGIRSYGVIRVRGTFPKTFGYFLAKDSVTGAYSLIEADLESITQVSQTDGEQANGSYVVPSNDAESRNVQGPVRTYFRP